MNGFSKLLRNHSQVFKRGACNLICILLSACNQKEKKNLYMAAEVEWFLRSSEDPFLRARSKLREVLLISFAYYRRCTEEKIPKSSEEPFLRASEERVLKASEERVLRTSQKPLQKSSEDSILRTSEDWRLTNCVFSLPKN